MVISSGAVLEVSAGPGGGEWHDRAGGQGWPAWLELDAHPGGSLGKHGKRPVAVLLEVEWFLLGRDSRAMVSVKSLGRDSSVRSDLLILIMTYCWSPWVQQVESNDTPVVDESEATLENTPSKSRGQFYAKIPGIRWVVFLFQGIYYDFVWFLWFMGVSNCVWMCPTYIASKGPFQCQVYCHNGDLQKGLKVLLGAVGSHRWVTANYQKTERSARSGCSCLWGYIGLTWFYYTTISKQWTYFRQYFLWAAWNDGLQAVSCTRPGIPLAVMWQHGTVLQSSDGIAIFHICHTGVESKPIQKKIKTKQNRLIYLNRNPMKTYEHPLNQNLVSYLGKMQGTGPSRCHGFAGLQCLHRGQQLPRRGESLGGLQSRIETGHSGNVGKTSGNLPGNVIICWNILLDLSRLIFICQCRGL